MPIAAKHPCGSPGCAALVPRGQARCDACTTKRHAGDAELRGTAAERGYGYRWQQARARFLLEHPLCAICAITSRTAAATVVDHIIPHRGDQLLFWDEANWQPCCESCHNSKTAREDGGFGHPRKEVKR